MTISSYNLVMKEVRIAELKAKLSEHLRAVRRGHTITVLDRDEPIARIVPYRKDQGGVRIRKPLPGAGRLQDVPLPPDRKSTRLNSSHHVISYAAYCLQKKT